MNSNILYSTTIALALICTPLTNFANTLKSQNNVKQPLAKPTLFIPPIKLDKVHLNNSNAYALDMLRNFNKDAGNKNLVFSPTSLQIILGMLGDATDNTELLKQINFAWHEPSSINIEAINKQLTLRIKHIKQPTDKQSPKAQVTLANGLFINNTYKIDPDYQTNIANYNAEIMNLDFSKWNAVPTINKWINQHTQKQIPKIINTLANPKHTSMVIANAIAFDGKWPQGYFIRKQTKPMLFNGIKNKRSVYTMHQDKLKQYYEDDNLQAIYVPYEGYQYALFVLLPKSKQKDALDNLLNKLDIDYFNNITNGFFNSPQNISYSGTLFLPRFKITYDNQELLEKSNELLAIDLNPMTNKNATFNQAIQANKQSIDLSISKMAHRAVITVNEKGTKAAATTHTELVPMSIPAPAKQIINFTMKVDHPFIYGIMDDQQQLLFLGTVKSLP